MIPKYIHQICPTGVHLTSLGWWKKTHPHWDCTLWTLTEGKALIAKFYPDFSVMYETYRTEEEQMNALRIVLLHRYGGMVVDHRLYPKKRLDSFFMNPNYEVYVSEDTPELFIASSARNEFMMEYLEKMYAVAEKPWWKMMGKEYICRQRTNFWGEIQTTFKMTTKKLSSLALDKYIQYEPLFPPNRWRWYHKLILLLICVVLIRWLRNRYYPRSIMLLL